MESITRNFNTNENFWETNPSFLSIRAFEEFHDKDKSKGKNKSSQIMWAIAFLIDPHEHNVWRNLNDTDKKKLIAEDFLKQEDFDWGEHAYLMDKYYEHALTLPEKDFYELVEKLHERKEFIKNTAYTLDHVEEMDNGKYKTVKGTASQLDKMLVDTAKLYAQLEEVKNKLEESKQLKGETKGGMQESATEQKLL